MRKGIKQIRSLLWLLPALTSVPVFAGSLSAVLGKVEPTTEHLLDLYKSQILALQKSAPRPARHGAKAFWRELSQANSVGELARLMDTSNLHDVDKQFVAILARDLFKNSSHVRIPAFTKAAVSEIVRIVQMGIVNFQRAEGSSVDNPWREGANDIVGYRVVQSDESVSYLLAYREGTAKRRSDDARPRVNLLLMTGADPEQMRKVVVGDHRRTEQGLEARSQAEQQVVNLLKF